MTHMNSSQCNAGLICPGCGGAMTELRAMAHYGKTVVVDKCPACGGVWFDKWELYSLTEEGLRSLHDHATGPSEREGALCPRCLIALSPFIDPTLPKDANIGRCNGCSGAWLDRNELEIYTRFKETVLTARSMQFRIDQTNAAREYEQRWLGKAKTSPVERIDATPADTQDNQAGSASLDDRAIGTDSTGGDD